MRKTAFTIFLVLLLALLAAGCTSASQPAAPAAATPVPAATQAAPAHAPAAAVPDLVGTWNGTMQGYEEGKGYMDMSKDTMSMVVTEQKGRIFSGHYVFVLQTRQIELPFAGIIGADGTSLSIVENANGYTTGTVSGNTIELTHMDDADPYSVAIDTLKRV